MIKTHNIPAVIKGICAHCECVHVCVFVCVVVVVCVCGGVGGWGRVLGAERT